MFFDDTKIFQIYLGNIVRFPASHKSQQRDEKLFLRENFPDARCVSPKRKVKNKLALNYELVSCRHWCDDNFVSRWCHNTVLCTSFWCFRNILRETAVGIACCGWQLVISTFLHFALMITTAGQSWRDASFTWNDLPEVERWFQVVPHRTTGL